MATEYLDCEIEIRPRNGDIFPFSFTAPGGDARGILQLPTPNPAYQALAHRLASLDTDEELLTQLGQLLFEALFRDKVKEVYIRTQGGLQPGQGLRLKLNIAASEGDVAALPWEFLYDPDQGPLAMLDVSIVRYLPQSAPIPRLKTNLPLKMLLTGAQPTSLAQAGIGQELEEIRAALAELEQQQRIQITTDPHLTRGNLQRYLRQGFHVWHFAGHGEFAANGQSGRLVLEEADGDAAPISAPELRILLRGSSVRLIVLDACESAKLATDPLRSLAPALIAAQVPGVIAMQFAAPGEATRAFASEFYRALAEGLPIDACVTEGRKAVMGVTGLGQPDWGIPVVYTRAPDGRLFDLPAPAPEPAPPVPPSGGVNISIGAGSHLEDSPISVSGVGTIIQGQAGTSSDRADQIKQLRDLRRIHTQRLHVLELQAAKFGEAWAPAHILIEIGDLKAKIADLDRQIQELGG